MLDLSICSPMYPTKDEFKTMLTSWDLDQIVDTHLFAGLPFSFSKTPELYDQILYELSQGLQVEKQDICIVGSARIGFSLSPPRFGTPFDQFSDVDVVVVSADLFDPSWMNILDSPRGRRSSFRSRTRKSLTDHRKKHYIYQGWIYPDSLVDALEIGERWLTTFNGLSRIPVLSSRRISGRLYRTWDHARAYHYRGLELIQESLSASP